MADTADRHDDRMVSDHVARIAVVESQNRRTERRLADHDSKIEDVTTTVTTIVATMRSNKLSILASVSIMGFLLAVLQIILRYGGSG